MSLVSQATTKGCYNYGMPDKNGTSGWGDFHCVLAARARAVLFVSGDLGFEWFGLLIGVIWVGGPFDWFA